MAEFWIGRMSWLDSSRLVSGSSTLCSSSMIAGWLVHVFTSTYEVTDGTWTYNSIPVDDVTPSFAHRSGISKILQGKCRNDVWKKILQAGQWICFKEKVQHSIFTVFVYEQILLRSVMFLLTCSRWTYYLFSGPPYGIIFSKNLKKNYSHYKFLCQWNDVQTTK